MTKQTQTAKLDTLIEGMTRTNQLLGALVEALGSNVPVSFEVEPAPAPAVQKQPKIEAKPTIPAGFKLEQYKMSRKNTQVFVLTGDTKPIKEQLKALGCKWVRAKLGWTVLESELDAVNKILAR